MKYRVAEIEGALLDAAVAKATGQRWRIEQVMSSDLRARYDTCLVAPSYGWDKRLSDWVIYRPSRNWAEGGQIIERERISVKAFHSGGWQADPMYTESDAMDGGYHEKSPLIAAMRAYVASRFGEEIEL